jgi:diguanylate cyclase (GGDEF)-like protein
VPSATLLRHLDEVVATWQELCTWDPELPPDATLHRPDVVVRSIAEALDRPQPLGWGIDPALIGPVELLAAEAHGPELVAAQLVCLREALHRHLVLPTPESGRLEIIARIDMILDRMITHAVREATHHLRTMAFVDPLTGLPNRRAFDDDLARETSRARRHGHVLSLAVLDVDGLKRTNDELGHDAGDSLLRAVGVVLRAALRNEDVAYRIGGDEFALLLPDVDVADDRFLQERLRSVGSPPLSLGVASSARDPLDELASIADERLYEGRRRRRR